MQKETEVSSSSSSPRSQDG